jgi:hypothetical protein
VTALVPKADRARLQALARRLGVTLRNDLAPEAWALPLLEAVLDRLEALERDLGVELRSPTLCRDLPVVGHGHVGGARDLDGLAEKIRGA